MNKGRETFKNQKHSYFEELYEVTLTIEFRHLSSHQ